MTLTSKAVIQTIHSAKQPPSEYLAEVIPTVRNQGYHLPNTKVKFPKRVMLDLFCGVGGAAMGYSEAGFDVVGVDIKPQPNFPFQFIQDDALDFFHKYGHEFDAVHASPPCQGYSPHVVSDGRWSHGVHNGYNERRLIEPLREMFVNIGTPYVIENVLGAKNYMREPIRLCGAMFDLKTPRHRLFESNMSLIEPVHTKCRGLQHPVAEEWMRTIGTTSRRIYSVVGKGRQRGSYAVWRALLDIPWARRDYELAEAIPPAYTKYIGIQILDILEGVSESVLATY